MADAELLKRLQAKFGTVDNRIGGKGTPRRKRKTVHKVAAGDDKKLQAALKKLGSQPVSGIEEVSIFLADGRLIHFAAPKVNAVLPSNLFAVSGTYTVKSAMDAIDTDMLSNLGPEGMAALRKALAQSGAAGAADTADDDDIPELVSNFEAAAAVEEPKAE